MDDWMKLTEEDVARAHRLTRDHPLMPEIIILTPDDLAASEPHPRPASRNVPAELAEERGAGDESPVAGQPSPRQAVVAPAIQITLDDLTPTPPQRETSPQLLALEQLMYRLVNQERSSHLARFVGTAALTWHDEVAAIARGHSHDMLRRQYVAHVSPEGMGAAQRLSQGSIRFAACGENIGVVYGAASHGEQGIHEIHLAFMKQPRSLTNHRGNLLNPVWTHVGIGVAYREDGALVATQLFLSAPGARLRGR